MRARDVVPVPSLLAMRTVVAFGPHPDDLELGAGGTLARLLDDGRSVVWVVATDGRAGTTDPAIDPERLVAARRQEQEAALALLGPADLVWLGFPDLGLAAAGATLVRRVIGIVRTYRPDVVFAPDPWLPYESHPDHRALGFAVAEAVTLTPFPQAYPEAGPPAPSPAVAFYATAWPNTRVDIAPTFDRKTAALAAHRSQYPPPADQVIAAYSRLVAEEQGREAGVALAEAFKVLSPLHLHFNVDAWRM